MLLWVRQALIGWMGAAATVLCSLSWNWPHFLVLITLGDLIHHFSFIMLSFTLAGFMGLLSFSVCYCSLHSTAAHCCHKNVRCSSVHAPDVFDEMSIRWYVTHSLFPYRLVLGSSMPLAIKVGFLPASLLNFCLRKAMCVDVLVLTTSPCDLCWHIKRGYLMAYPLDLDDWCDLRSVCHAPLYAVCRSRRSVFLPSN